MRRFSIGNDVIAGNDINVGIAPGKFDTKQLILSSIAVLTAEVQNKRIRFVRTTDMDELSKCGLFINDDFTTMFPVIPSYHDIEMVWNKNSEIILSQYSICDKEGYDFVNKSMIEKICNLEAIDCIMHLYNISTNAYTDSFGEALSTTLKFIDKFIDDSVKERMHIYTIKSYFESSSSNYIELPIYVQGWRHIIELFPNSQKIEYAIFPDGDAYIIEAFDKNICLKKYVKGMANVSYSGRFFVRINDIETAQKMLMYLPSKLNDSFVIA